MSSDHPYEQLTPDCVLDAVEQSSLLPDGHLLALNSYENRVYQVGIEEAQPVVAKFYRPNRWSRETILEEHSFALELMAQEIPVVAPLLNDQGESLLEHQGFLYALFPRRGGRWPELEDPEIQYRIGRFLGRIHAIGAIRPFTHRPTLDIESFGIKPYQFLLEKGFISAEMQQQYRDLAEALIKEVEERFASLPSLKQIRLHGDFHPGNILWTDTGAHIVDLDDCRMGPAVQDLWMLLSGDRKQMTIQLSELLEGYNEFYDFDLRELHLIEPLRSLRIIHYAYWLARRWKDPAFPHSFPWFNTPRYWDEHILTLREQLISIEQPPLNLGPA
ncbi:MAG: serine/threonine protein kinase [Candidatus Polarisedimenticolaceae bacterium]|nr:serine/threonine protein kinase [Candidatus Polarisedimenticolaceae bacterium]